MTEKTISNDLPTDSDGHLPRQCPHCEQRFSIHGETYEEGRYLNLRCPYCGTLFCRRLLILASCRCRVEEDKDTASAVSDTDDSARCVWIGIGRSGPAPTGSLA